ncbi:MAG TPA: S8 family serine peptidase [Gemmatimonadaceae bacterium]|nr:S8 family serine peptidase [Gemmatimonadaceae bacterium]
MYLRSLVLGLLVAPALTAQGLVERPAKRESHARERRALDEIARVRELGLSPRSARVALSRDESGAITADVFVRGAPGVEDALTALGARVGIRAGEWLTARVPVDRLRDVRSLAGVRAVEFAQRLSYSTSTMDEIRASGVRRRVDRDEFSGATGQGTIVGIVDSGIDFRHMDFVDDVTGRSRILYLWDHAPPAGATGAPPGPVSGLTFTYGIECRQDQLGRNGSCPSRDRDGHGTHVAGIAAGDGSGANRGLPRYEYVGVAPEADLIVVRTSLSGTSVIDGVAYIFARAEQLGKPAVVNLSLGTQTGPHDGKQGLSVMMDALSGPGRIIVAAAGNDGSNFGLVGSLHGEATVARGDSGIIEFAMPNYTRGSGSDDDLMVLQAFYSPQDTFTVTLQRPDGSRIDVGFNAAVASLGTGGGVLAYNGTARGDSILDEFESSSGFSTSSTNYFTAFIGEWIDGGTAPAVGTWRLIFRKTAGSGSGLVDSYIPFAILNTEPFFTTGGTNRRLVQSPADAERVIAVGGYHAFTSWRGFDGEEWSLAPGSLWPANDLLFFSSPGPTRDGRLKPEIVAPGVALSSMSRDANFGGDERLVSPDSAHVLEAGTSMSAPHVTGAVALMLSVYHHLTPEQAIDALQRGARRDAFTSRTFTGDPNTSPNASWGFGKLDVAAALANVRALMLAQGESFNISQNPVRSSPVVIRFGEPPRRVDLFDFAGKRVRSFRATDFDDATTLRWNLQVEGGGVVVNGVYLLVAELPSGLMRRKVFIVR